jgi:hypothetical protein
MSNVSPYQRIARAKFKRELEEAWLDLEAIQHQRNAYLAHALADEEAARKSLQAKLSLVFQSLSDAA